MEENIKSLSLGERDALSLLCVCVCIARFVFLSRLSYFIAIAADCRPPPSNVMETTKEEISSNITKDVLFIV